ncbi:dual specificity protein phosphatase 3-like [Frankliniella occidentalis]|uniref:Dual specificity protein phosphatase n=1 Tax=Frankliniella occidentalis TaxID=133901 RepID=A0A6J1TK01_FRAOC|nr:dual specificity protein phosphatase 3-like [Frankliniella occidentalis]
MSWGREVRAEDLMEVLFTELPRPAPIQLPGFQNSPRTWNRRKLGLDCDEVYPDIFVGDAATVRDKQYLKEIRITHVLNCAEGRRAGHLNVNGWYFQDADIKYLGLPLDDMPSANIEDYFQCAAHFIDCALYHGGRVFVNCMMGVSRSATIVMAFLMLRRGLGAVEAVRTVRRRRDVWPNAGFLHKLAELHNRLRQARQQQQRCNQRSYFYLPLPYASIGAPMAQP